MTGSRTEPAFAAAVFPLAAGSLCALLGLSVLTGWYTHDLALIHVLPAFVGMAYNTALGFLLAGVSLAAASRKRMRGRRKNSEPHKTRRAGWRGW